ncbi:EAL domain-containing protein [Bradyrhizobium diazoefficiens]|uniref:EAL domain-containing protein n=1 Tax=Bradyrhizobium diazoefficiens TaxID=1355477 RepID=UPI002899DEFF|nr:EAL domain-containing protein [Bradyrhizobium diazoefficiens]
MLAIATGVLRVEQGLGMTIVAEGVDTEGQRKMLAELGSDVAQGFLYAPALPPVAFERWLIEHCAEQARGLLGRLDLKPVGGARRGGRRRACTPGSELTKTLYIRSVLGSGRATDHDGQARRNSQRLLANNRRCAELIARSSQSTSRFVAGK